MDHPRRAGHIERRTVAEGSDLLQRDRAKAAVHDREEEKTQERYRPCLSSDLILGTHLATRQCGIELMDAHRGRALMPQPLGKPDVVGVRVSEYERAHVGERSPHRRQLARQVVPISADPGVDDRYLAGFLEQIRVDQAGPDTVDTRRELHFLRAFVVAAAFDARARFGSAVAATVS